MRNLPEDIRQKLLSLKNQYQAEGFVILGVFGSVARGEETPDSDIDLLYQVEKPFLLEHSGFKALQRLDRIKQELTEALGRPVDLAPKNTSNRILLEEVERDLLYV